MKDKIMALADAYAAAVAVSGRSAESRAALEAAVDALVQPTVSQAVYEAAVKGRQEFRRAYRDAKARIAELEAAVDALVQPPTPLPGADWTITMRRMMAGGCSKRKCTCKAGDEPNCIWWDEPGDAPTTEHVVQPLTEQEIDAVYRSECIDLSNAVRADFFEFARAIEAKLRERSAS